MLSMPLLCGRRARWGGARKEAGRTPRLRAIPAALLWLSLSAPGNAGLERSRLAPPNLEQPHPCRGSERG